MRRGPTKGRYDRASIDDVLDRGLLAHVAFADGDAAVCIPMLYARVGDTVYIHGSTASRAVRLLAAGAPACVTVTLVHALVLARSAFEHSANYDSVMVFGTFALVEDEAERLRAFEAFTEKLLPGRWDEARQPSAKELKATSILALEIDEASAKVRSGGARGRRLGGCRAGRVGGGRPDRVLVRNADGLARAPGGHSRSRERQTAAGSSSSSWMIRGESWTQIRSRRPGPRFTNLCGVSGPTTRMSPAPASTS